VKFIFLFDAGVYGTFVVRLCVYPSVCLYVTDVLWLGGMS